MVDRLRRVPPANPVTIYFDNEEVVAERDESLAVSLVGAGFRSYARSPKFHRPRGPYCFRGACEGCLVRINGEPNRLSCLTKVSEGMRVETQNSMGTRETDLLRVTDWFFPHGINHHELFAGVPVVSDVMQVFARRAAGLGLLPSQIRPVEQGQIRTLDVLVIGGGPAGLAMGALLAQRGRSVEIVDDALVVGGSLRAATGKRRATFEGIESLAANSNVTVRTHTLAAASYGDAFLIAGESGAEIVRPQTVILATGAYDGFPVFEGNDLPGVMSARAAGILQSSDVRAGEKPLVVVYEGGGPFGVDYAEETGAELVFGSVDRVRGRSRVRDVRVKTTTGARVINADAVIVDAPRAPVYELALQLGAKLTHEPRGYVVQDARIRDGVFAAGELAGWPYECDVMLERAQSLTRAIIG